MGENLFNKINMDNKELELEITDLSEVYNSAQKVLQLRHNGKSVEQTKEEFNFYLILSDYQEKYGQEYLNKTELKKRKTIFKKLSDNHLAEIANESGEEGIYFLKFVLDNWEVYTGLFFLILFLFDTWSLDLEKKHINLIKTQPIPLKRYYNAKFFFIFSVYLLIFLCYLATAFSIGIINGGIGSLEYPIYIRDTITLPLKNYLVISFIINMVASGIILSVIEWLSVVIKNVSLTLLISFIGIFLFNLLSEIIFSPKNYYLFFLFNSKSVIKNYYPFSLYMCFFLVIILLGIVYFIRISTIKVLLGGRKNGSFNNKSFFF